MFYISAIFDKELHNLKVAPFRRTQQRGPIVEVLSVDISSMTHQLANELSESFASCNHEGCRPILVPVVNLRLSWIEEILQATQVFRFDEVK